MFKIAGSLVTLSSDEGYSVCGAVKICYHTSPFKKHEVNCKIWGMYIKIAILEPEKSIYLEGQ